MIPTPLPDSRPNNVAAALGSYASELMNLQGPRGTTHEWLVAYLEWAGETHRGLRRIITAADADQLVFGGRYRDLLAMVDQARLSEMEQRTRAALPGSFGQAGEVLSARLVNITLMGELSDQAAAFTAAQERLQRETKHYQNLGTPLVPDTSFLMTHADELAEVEWDTLLVDAGWSVHLVVPMLVLDELDNLKDRGQDKAKTQARIALRTLDGAFRQQNRDPEHDPLRCGELRMGDERVTVELLPDPRGHARMPIADDEIIDRAGWVQGVSGRPVTVVTYDVGMSTRARQAGLLEKLQVKDPEPSGRALRRERAAERTSSAGTS